MNFEDYERTYARIYTEFAELVSFLLGDAIKKTEGVPRPQSTQARGKDVTPKPRTMFPPAEALNRWHVALNPADICIFVKCV